MSDFQMMLAIGAVVVIGFLFVFRKRFRVTLGLGDATAEFDGDNRDRAPSGASIEGSKSGGAMAARAEVGPASIKQSESTGDMTAESGPRADPK